MSNALVSVPSVDVHELGDVPELGVVPRRMLAQVIRAERFGEPADARGERRASPGGSARLGEEVV